MSDQPAEQKPALNLNPLALQPPVLYQHVATPTVKKLNSSAQKHFESNLPAEFKRDKSQKHKKKQSKLEESSEPLEANKFSFQQAIEEMQQQPEDAKSEAKEDENDYYMTDMDETNSITDQSLIILGNQQSGRSEKRQMSDIGNFKIFAQFYEAKRANNNSQLEKHQLIRQPNQFPQTNTSGQHNESVGFLTQRSGFGEQNSLANDSVILGSARYNNSSERKQLTLSKDTSVFSASLSTLLSPLESNRSKQSVKNSQTEAYLVYQLESVTSQLTEKSMKNIEIDNEIKELQIEYARTKFEYEQRKATLKTEKSKNKALRDQLNFQLTTKAKF